LIPLINWPAPRNARNSAALKQKLGIRQLRLLACPKTFPIPRNRHDRLIADAVLQ